MLFFRRGPSHCIVLLPLFIKSNEFAVDDACGPCCHFSFIYCCLLPLPRLSPAPTLSWARGLMIASHSPPPTCPRSTVQQPSPSSRPERNELHREVVLKPPPLFLHKLALSFQSQTTESSFFDPGSKMTEQQPPLMAARSRRG